MACQGAEGLFCGAKVSNYILQMQILGQKNDRNRIFYAIPVDFYRVERDYSSRVRSCCTYTAFIIFLRLVMEGFSKA